MKLIQKAVAIWSHLNSITQWAQWPRQSSTAMSRCLGHFDGQDSEGHPLARCRPDDRCESSKMTDNNWQLQWQQHPDQGYLETCDTCVRLCNMNTMNTHVSSGPVCEGFHIGLHCSSFNVIDICHILGNHQKPQNSAGSMAFALIIASSSKSSGPFHYITRYTVQNGTYMFSAGWWLHDSLRPFLQNIFGPLRYFPNGFWYVLIIIEMSCNTTCPPKQDLGKLICNHTSEMSHWTDRKSNNGYGYGMAPLFGKQQGCHQSGQEPCFFALGGLVEKRVCLATDVATEWPRLLLRKAPKAIENGHWNSWFTH